MAGWPPIGRIPSYVILQIASPNEVRAGASLISEEQPKPAAPAVYRVKSASPSTDASQTLPCIAQSGLDSAINPASETRALLHASSPCRNGRLGLMNGFAVRDRHHVCRYSIFASSVTEACTQAHFESFFCPTTPFLSTLRLAPSAGLSISNYSYLCLTGCFVSFLFANCRTAGGKVGLRSQQHGLARPLSGVLTERLVSCSLSQRVSVKFL